ncbi:SAM15 protein, partial [Polyodon spathula]|nr:SAM15 protein [Polyodon spathula]
MSAFMKWSCEDVSKWIESLGYQQYTACFTENYINGRKLILVNCSTLPRLGITDFKDMKAISGHVRELLEIKDPHWIRSIALPPVEPRRLFLEEKSRTGSTADSLTYIQFLKERGLDEYT